MSAKKARRPPRRAESDAPNERRAGKSRRERSSAKRPKRQLRAKRPPSRDDIENARLKLLGVQALLDVLRYRTSDSLSIVLTRGALQPLRDALQMLGQEDAQDLSWPGTLQAACVRLARGQRHEQAEL